MYDFSILGGKKVNDSHKKKRETDHHGGPPKVVLLVKFIWLEKKVRRVDDG